MSRNKEIARTVLIAVIVAVCFVVFFFRSMSIQLAEGDEYLALANAGSTTTQVTSAPRGEIVDCYGRAFTTNAAQYDIIIDKAQLTAGGENELILRLIGLMRQYGTEWNDELPISAEQPYEYIVGKEQEVSALRSALELGGYAGAEEAIYWLTEKYDLEECSAKDARAVAAVRYAMDVHEFSINNTYTFAADVGTELANIVRERQYELMGADIAVVAARDYPDGTLAPHIVGTTGLIDAEEWASLRDAAKTYAFDAEQGYRYNDYIGKTGIEQVYEQELRGKNGVRTIRLDNKGMVTSIEQSTEPVAGSNVVLTINRDLQKTAYDALAAKIKLMQSDIVAYPENQGHEADAGSVVAVDVKTGEILCMVNYPTYDISSYYEDYAKLVSDPHSPLINRATMGAYTVGSIYKPVVAVCGLASGLITATSTIYCGGRYSFYSGYQPACLGVHGNLNVLDALRQSCNIFFYDLGRREGIELTNKYASQFGLGKKTGIELPEAAGQLSSPATREAVGDEWGPGYVLQSSIGQLDHAFTPIQLAGYVQTLANNGTRMQLHLVKSITSYDFSEILYETPITVAEQVEASEEDFAVVREGMIRASYASLTDGTWAAGTSYGTWGVARGSTWYAKYGEEILVASKTGTPETSTEACNSTFICYAPADDPQIAVAVVIEKGWHGYTGASVARAVMEQYFFGSEEYDDVEIAGMLLS